MLSLRPTARDDIVEELDSQIHQLGNITHDPEQQLGIFCDALLDILEREHQAVHDQMLITTQEFAIFDHTKDIPLRGAHNLEERVKRYERNTTLHARLRLMQDALTENVIAVTEQCSALCFAYAETGLKAQDEGKNFLKRSPTRQRMDDLLNLILSTEFDEIADNMMAFFFRMPQQAHGRWLEQVRRQENTVARHLKSEKGSLKNAIKTILPQSEQADMLARMRAAETAMVEVCPNKSDAVMPHAVGRFLAIFDQFSNTVFEQNSARLNAWYQIQGMPEGMEQIYNAAERAVSHILSSISGGTSNDQQAKIREARFYARGKHARTLNL